MKGDDGQHLAFIELNDGTCLPSIQVLVSAAIAPNNSVNPLILTGSSICIKGEIKKAPEGKDQKFLVELHATEVLHAGMYGCVYIYICMYVCTTTMKLCH